MAISKQRQPTTFVSTVQTNILFATNTSGIDISNIQIVNVGNSQQQIFLGIVPTGQSLGTGNAFVWNVPIGASGFLNISVPCFLSSGDALMGSGNPGLGVYTSYLKLN